ncbi:hypothetical protein [Pseudomonas akapageensis]|uniref:hypothetical protein n=1 Tax=Pseudomonas akapageensis TaxID=2609961 RepID=UPI00140D4F1C|nr:hypothetical protein [Pseudomonas akapageensis]
MALNGLVWPATAASVAYPVDAPKSPVKQGVTPKQVLCLRVRKIFSRQHCTDVVALPGIASKSVQAFFLSVTF